MRRRRSAAAPCPGCAASSIRVRDERARQLLVEQREQQVLGVELGIAKTARALLRGGDRLLALHRQLVEVHYGFLRAGNGD